MPDVSGFLPSTRGFDFDNSWPSQPSKVIATPLGNIKVKGVSLRARTRHLSSCATQLSVGAQCRKRLPTLEQGRCLPASRRDV